LIDRPSPDLDQTKRYREVKPWRYILICILGICLIWFIWSANLKPLNISKEINEAVLLATRDQKCESAAAKMEKILNSDTYLDNYLQLQYIDIISSCLRYSPQYKLELSQKAIQILEQAIQSRPTYTRAWEFTGIYATKLIEVIQEQKVEISPEKEKELINKAYAGYEKAHQLSPGRQKIFDDLARLDMVLGRFEEAEKNSDRCIALNPEWANCYWTKALIKINAGQPDQAAQLIKIAEEKGYPVENQKAIGELINLYSRLIKITGKHQYYQNLAELYPKLIAYEPENPRFHASLAYVYKELGQFQEAKKQALIILELAPEMKETVEEFLKTLP
jgi:tetratricopeptide (TPR) repeat protein